MIGEGDYVVNIYVIMISIRCDKMGVVSRKIKGNILNKGYDN